jgi:hypothetical protein
VGQFYFGIPRRLTEWGSYGQHCPAGQVVDADIPLNIVSIAVGVRLSR